MRIVRYKRLSAFVDSLFSSQTLDFFCRIYVVGSVKRQDAPVVAAAVAAPVCPRGRLMLARSCRALEPTKRDDSTVHAAMAVEASDTTMGEEDTVNYEKLGKELEIASPLEIIDRALEMFDNEIIILVFQTFRRKIVTDTGVFWNSGAKDVALIEYAKLTGRPFRAFNLDTGRLNPETYKFFDTVEKHYGINIKHMFPDAREVHTLVRSKGLFSFSKMGTGNAAR
ncbi:probable 5'-adenylylsulfate reductase 1, chloroplastic [Zingiber officinale]|uniref:probable 5'-adenylylsulfate reductase 1, chloroplastic n=1 Tax=Zingiber officinale TaxID=94328 RepID=UPI001C4D8BCE|nr:probable 5'-adenylylsulfate reductase 1, chloroplastic [Zingiber officinale]